jgi:hypothetical protein
MPAIDDLVIHALQQVWITFTHNWPFLLASVVISVALRLYVDPKKATGFIMKYRRVGIFGATAAAVATPFCSCGTTAVILGMMASTIPWAPIVAFMVASPLTSPEELIYSAGIFGWPFAIAFFASSILLGLLGGFIAEFIEARGWLVGQARMAMSAPVKAVSHEIAPAKKPVESQGCACSPVQQPVQIAQPVLAFSASMPTTSCCSPIEPAPIRETLPNPALVHSCGCGDAQPVEEKLVPVSACGCGSSQVDEAPVEATAGSTPQKITLRQWGDELFKTGKQLLVMFLGFAFIGYLLNGLIPQEWVAALFGKGNVYSVPLAATLGLPFYINTEGSLPLVRALIDGGMSQGAALAFLITGAGTSIGAITGALTIARWRVIGVVVGTLWVGAIALGAAYDLLLVLHAF